MPDEALLNESGTKDQSASRISGLAWLWKLLFTLLLGPVLLFSNRLPLWVVLLALGLLLAPWIVRGARTGRLIPATPINFLLLPLLLIFLPLSLWISPLFWQASWPKATSLLWSAAVFFAVVDAVPPGLTAVQHQSRLRILVAIYVAVGVFMTGTGLLAMDSVGSRLPLPISVAGLLGQSINPNEVGGIITLYLPLVVAGWAGTWAYPEQRSLLRFAGWSLLALFFGGVLLLTASLSAMIGSFAGCGFVLLILNRHTRLLLVPISIVTLLSLGFVRLSPLFDRLVFATRLKWNFSILTRANIWSQALHSIQDFPLLGTGLGNFRYVAPVLYPLGDRMQDLGHAHNLFWQAALDFGLLGGLLFGAMWVVLAIYLVRSLRNAGVAGTDIAIRILSIGMLGSLIAHAVYGLFDALAPGARPGFALWYLFGLCVATGASIIHAPITDRRQRIGGAAVFLFLSVVLLWLFLPMQRASSVTAAALLKESQNIDNAVSTVARVAESQCRADWLVGLLEHKRGNIEARDIAWERLLGCSAQHTDVMRNVSPNDRGLAALVVAKQPQDSAGLFWLASLEVRDDLDAAVAHYEQGLAIEPGDAVRWVELARAREAAGDLGGALAAFEKACFLVDVGGHGCLNAGRMHLLAGSYELAEERYRKSIDQLPDWPANQRGLADTLLAMGQVEEAMPYLTFLAENGDTAAQQQLQELRAGGE